MSDDPFIDQELNHDGELFIYTVYILSMYFILIVTFSDIHKYIYTL